MPSKLYYSSTDCGGSSSDKFLCYCKDNPAIVVRYIESMGISPVSSMSGDPVLPDFNRLTDGICVSYVSDDEALSKGIKHMLSFHELLATGAIEMAPNKVAERSATYGVTVVMKNDEGEHEGVFSIRTNSTMSYLLKRLIASGSIVVNNTNDLMSIINNGYQSFVYLYKLDACEKMTYVHENDVVSIICDMSKVVRNA